MTYISSNGLFSCVQLHVITNELMLNVNAITYICFQLRVDPVGPAFDLTLPIEIIIGTLPHRARTDLHLYANIHPQDQTSRSSQQSNACHDVNSRANQNSHLVQSHSSRTSQQNQPPPDLSSRSSQNSNETGNSVIQRQPIGVPVLPMQGGKVMINPAQMPNQSNPNSRQSQGASREPMRPSSRSSSAPSTASTSSVHTYRSKYSIPVQW